MNKENQSKSASGVSITSGSIRGKLIGILAISILFLIVTSPIWIIFLTSGLDGLVYAAVGILGGFVMITIGVIALTRKFDVTPYLLCIALVLIGLFPLPYEYYIFLRWALTLMAGWILFRSYFVNFEKVSLLIAISILIIFNPYIPISLQKETWLICIPSALVGHNPLIA